MEQLACWIPEADFVWPRSDIRTTPSSARVTPAVSIVHSRAVFLSRFLKEIILTPDENVKRIQSFGGRNPKITACDEDDQRMTGGLNIVNGLMDE